MGLVCVQFVMEAEDVFNLSFSNEELADASIRTIGEFIDFIRQKLPAQKPCSTQRAFYRLRSAAGCCLKVPRNEIKPSTPWHRLLPRMFKSIAWSRIRKVLRLRVRRPGPNDTVGSLARQVVLDFPGQIVGWINDRNEIAEAIKRIVVKVYKTDDFRALK